MKITLGLFTEEASFQSDDLATIDLLDNKKFIYDWHRIEVDYTYFEDEITDEELKPSAKKLQTMARDWIYLGLDDSRHNFIFARPFFKALPNKIPDNTKWEAERGDIGMMVNILEINDLVIELNPVSFNGLKINTTSQLKIQAVLLMRL